MLMTQIPVVRVEDQLLAIMHSRSKLHYPLYKTLFRRTETQQGGDGIFQEQKL